MTLDTRVAIGGGQAVDAQAVYDLCRKMVNTPNGVEPEVDESPKYKSISNPPGIGADAWLAVQYGADGPIPAHECGDDCYLDEAEDLAAEGESRCMDARFRDRGRPDYSGWASVIVSFDTTYGHRGPNGETCSDLHAKYVYALGQYLDSKGLDWKWEDEYQGEWYDRYDHLDEFGDAHRSTGADEWFRSFVLPAIAAEAVS